MIRDDSMRRRREGTRGRGSVPRRETVGCCAEEEVVEGLGLEAVEGPEPALGAV